MKLSLIIPVYNAEKFLHKCLESVVLQTLNHDQFEVVLVDDGSTDNSLKIAESFSDKILNLQIFSQHNKGEAGARNLGLQNAQGKYLAFLDNDDYLDRESLKVAVEILERDQLDILYLRIKQVDLEGNFRDFVFDMPAENIVLSGLQFMNRPFPATIYKRSIVNSENFNESVLIGTDSVFNIIVQSKAKKVTFTKKAVYNYTYREDSLSKKSLTHEAFKGFLNVIAILTEYRKSNFLADDLNADAYFDRSLTVFITRIIDFNILPTFSKENYVKLISTLKLENQLHLLGSFSKKYRFIDHSFSAFATYQKYLLIKSKIHKLIYRA